MKQPLMSLPPKIPPAQAEALYDTSLHDEGLDLTTRSVDSSWPGEDWDDEADLYSVNGNTLSGKPLSNMRAARALSLFQ